MKPNFLIYAFFALVLVAAAPACAEDDIDALMKEVTALETELADIPRKFDENIQLKRKHEEEVKALEPEAARLDEKKEVIKQDAQAVAASCSGGTVETEAEAAAINARCQAQKRDLEQRMEANNAEARAKAIEPFDVIHAKEEQRIADFMALMTRRDEIRKRVAVLKKTILLAQKNACASGCAGEASDVAAAQCLQNCWDGAKESNALPRVEKSGPNTVITPNEPVKQKGLKINPVPPPPVF